MERVVLGLGSNVGNRAKHIKNAIKEISLLKGINVLAVSSLYETEPWGLKNQRKFLNCVIICLCRLDPAGLYKYLGIIENSLGRKRRVKWGPRVIDIDILFFGNITMKSNKIIIPHPMIDKRNFVLVPLAELIPDYIHPVLKRKMAVLLSQSSDKSKVAKYN